MARCWSTVFGPLSFAVALAACSAGSGPQLGFDSKADYEFPSVSELGVDEFLEESDEGLKRFTYYKRLMNQREAETPRPPGVPPPPYREFIQDAEVHCSDDGPISRSEIMRTLITAGEYATPEEYVAYHASIFEAFCPSARPDIDTAAGDLGVPVPPTP